MRKTKCAACGEVGGRFLFRNGKYYHVGRCTSAPQRYGPISTFPFTTRNIGDGTPVTVESMRHLRQLESHHGVSSEVYNYDKSNVAEHRPD
jgi:hypothetical protein